jgi:hypothetical protein
VARDTRRRLAIRVSPSRRQLVAERDGDRDHVPPPPPWYAIEPADEFGEEIVGIQLLDDQLQERARPCELSRTCCKQGQHARATLSPPAFGIELPFGPESR